MSENTLLSQRDKRWGDKYLGKSKSKVARYGCTITSISMATAYFKQWVSPYDLAHKLSYTADGLLIWGSLPNETCFKLEKRFYGRRDDLIQEALKNPKKVVLIQVENYHWVLGLGKTIFGGYRVADPWTAEKISLFSRYKSITGGAVLTLK